jgi:Ca-activated chloride channel family protein
VTSGNSFAAAPELGAGRWSANVVPGATGLFKLPLEFGQYARVAVTFPPAGGDLQEVINSSYAPQARLDVFDPMRALVGSPEDAETEEYAGLDGGEAGPVTLFTVTSPVSGSSEPAFSLSNNDGGTFTTAGDYYVGVSLGPKNYTVTFPFTIDVEILGEPVSGPAYAGGTSWSVAADVGDSDQSAQEDSAPAEDAGDDDSRDDSDAKAARASDRDGDSGDSGVPVWVLAAGGGGVLLVALFIVVLVLSRRGRAGGSPVS